jgi:Fe-S-cluster containining protein
MLRIDPEQRFSCSQCGRCCHRFDVIVSEAEIEHYRRRNAVTWFREGVAADDAEGAARDPFEAIPDLPGLWRIRKRADGACGFLSADNRCRIHEQLGAARKPLTCRLFPFSFHAAPDAVVVTASFACPTIVANQGAPIAVAESRSVIEGLRKEWFATPQPTAAALELVAGRSMDGRTARILRDHLLVMLKRETADIRGNIALIAQTLDDLTRPRVLALADADFAEYVALTVPHAATRRDPPPISKPGAVARLLQYGFVYLVAATRATAERRGQSRLKLRLVTLRLLAHFHRLAPGIDRVNVAALRRGAVDINDPEIRPIVFHYLRSTFETLGARGRPILNEIAIAFSYLNAACALAIMNASAAGKTVDRQIFIEALMEASDLAHAASGQWFDWALTRLAGGTAGIWTLAVKG